jgi:hypothetical protein
VSLIGPNDISKGQRPAAFAERLWPFEGHVEGVEDAESVGRQ